MKSYETHSCGYRLKFNGPETVEAYEEIGGAGTCLRDAVRLAINAETLPAWQEAFAAVLEERTRIPREIDQEATSQLQARSRTPETVKPVNERVKPYTKRVLAIWVNGDKSKQAQLQQWAQETADTISIIPAPLETEPVKLPPISKTELAKATEILGHEPAYIEERINLMLSDIPDYPLARNLEGKPEPESLARLINRWLNKKLNL
jgi:hypothetical protein